MGFYSFALPTGQAPEGRRYVPIQFVSRSSGQPQALTVNLADSGISMARGILIDNSLNSRALILTAQDTGHSIFVPAYNQYTGPLYTGGLNIVFSIFTNEIVGAQVPISLFNFEPPQQVAFKQNPNVMNYLTGINTNSVIGYVGTSSPIKILNPNPLRFGLFFTCAYGAGTNCFAYLGYGDETGLNFLGNFWGVDMVVNDRVSYSIVEQGPLEPLPKSSIWLTIQSGNSVNYNIGELSQ
ncbi:MAG: hypothetical protein P4M15_08685 [Alphaproteobacteria bacterium]|nr:hypothetical protein [Alphaproteobacteria bacterium]